MSSCELIFQNREEIGEKPYVTVAIPTFNRSSLIKESINSVLNQDFSLKYEIVVVDNCSEEQKFNEILDYIKSLKVTDHVVIKIYRNTENIGLFGNWNQCIHSSQAEWITILNDDDLLTEDFISTTYDNREGNKLVVCSQKKVGSLAEKGIYRKVLNTVKAGLEKCLKGNIYDYTLEDMIYAGPTAGSLGVLFNRECAKNIGLYDADLWPTADYEFIYQYWKRYGVRKLNSIHAFYRLDDNTSLKINTLKGFIENEYNQRLRMVDENITPGYREGLYKYLIKVSATNYAIFYNNMNSKFSVNDELERLGLKKCRFCSLELARFRSMFLFISFYLLSKL